MLARARERLGWSPNVASSVEDGRPVSVSIVDSRAAAVAANERAREWVAANMADLIPDPPEVAMGEMLVDAATFDEDEDERGGAPEAPWTDGGV